MKGETHMNDDRPAWERKLDRDFAWKKVWTAAGILMLLGILLLLSYHIPIVTDYHRTFTGWELHYDPDTDPTFEHPEIAKESTVRFEGKLYRYLWKDDYFDGLVYFDDFTTSPNPKYKISETEKIYFSDKEVWLSDVTNPLWGAVIERGGNERIYYAFVNFEKENEFFAFLISTVHENGNGWSSGDKYIVIPAESPGIAAEKYQRNVRQMLLDDIAEAEKAKPET